MIRNSREGLSLYASAGVLRGLPALGLGDEAALSSPPQSPISTTVRFTTTSISKIITVTRRTREGIRLGSRMGVGGYFRLESFAPGVVSFCFLASACFRESITPDGLSRILSTMKSTVFIEYVYEPFLPTSCL